MAEITFAGKKGAFNAKIAEGATFVELVNEAATTLGLPGFDAGATQIVADGQVVEPEAEVPANVEEIAVAPNVNLG